MRILLDESLPRKLGFKLPGHHVRTVQMMGWNGLVNGHLLVTAASEFDVFITGDKNMQYQQSASQLPISVVVLVAPNNKLESFLPLVGKLISALEDIREPSFVQLEIEK